MDLSGVEFAVGLIGDLERREIDAAIELQRLIAAEHRDLRGRMVRLLGSILGVSRARYRLHVYHPATGLLRGFENRGPQAIKNPA